MLIELLVNTCFYDKSSNNIFYNHSSDKKLDPKSEKLKANVKDKIEKISNKTT
jgi:hypothetical protein